MDRKIEIESNSINPEAYRYIHHLVPGIKSFSKYMGFAVSLIGLLVISGWLLGMEQLSDVFAGLSAMKANAAIAFVTAGLSLWLRGGTSPKSQTTVQILGAITGLIGLLTLGEYVLGRNLGIDELIFKDLAASGALHPGRMSFLSALNFTMMGMALLLLDSNNERKYNLAQSMTLVAGIIAYVALTGHLFDVDSLYRVGVTSPMAFHTALSFILLFAGMVCAQPEDGWMGYLIADTPGGDLLRRLLPVAFVAPILLAWLRLQGQLAGYYETAFGTALLAVAITLFLSVVIWFNAKGLTRVDLDRRQMEQNLRESEEKYRALFDSIDEGFCIIEKVESKAGKPLDFRYVVANPAFATQSGVGDVVGKTIRQAFPGELEEWFETYDTILRTGEALRFERGLPTQGRVLELYAFRIEDETHRRVAVIFKDITARKQAENRLTLLTEISELTRKFEDANELLFAVSEAIGEYLQVRRCLFNEIDLENDREIVHRDYCNGVESVAGMHKLSDYSSVTSAEMEAGKTVVNCDSKIDVRTAQDYEMAYAPNGERAYVAVPLMRENHWAATLWVSDDVPRQWSKEEISLLETVAERTWAAVERARAEESLAASEEKYRALFDSIDEGFCIIEKVESKTGGPLDFRYLVANPAFGAQAGIGDVVGKTIRQAFPGEPEEWFETYDTILRTGEAIRFERGLVTQGRVLELYAFRVEDKTHRQVAVIFKDITEQKRTEQALTEFAQQQEALYKLTNQLQRTNSLEDVFNAALDAILGALQCDRASILLFDDSDLMHFVAWRDLSDNYRKATDGHSPWKPDEKNAEPICINDIATGEISGSLKTVIQAEGICSLAFIPLVSEGKLIGKFMTYYNDYHVFSDSELDLSLTIARQLAFGIERKRAEGSLRESKERYRNLFDLVPVGVYTCDAKGFIQEFNQRAVELWGREPLKHDPKEKFCGSFKMFYQDGRFMPHDTCPMARILGGETLEPHELEILVERPDGKRHNIVAHPLPLKDESGQIVGAINSFYDITARKQAEEALHQLNLQLESQVQSRTAKLRSVNQSLHDEITERRRVEEQLIYQSLLISNVNDAIIATDDNLTVTYWNPTAEQIYGWSAEEVMGRMVSDILQSEFIDGNTRSESLQKVNELRELRTAVTHLRKDGSRIFVEAHTSTLLNEDGKLTGYVSINRDITERKKAEQELRLNRDRLRSLSQRLVEVQEEERRTIANELHDRVGQSLSALNINLTIMRDQLSADSLQRIGPRLNDSMQLAAEAITLVRDVMSDLRPSVLDDYGLEAALQSYLDQFKSRYGIKILFEKPEQPILRMGPSIEMTFLRIAQESLLNVARHARADQVNLSLGQDGNAVRLIVHDNGNGIVSWQEANRPGSHGLTIMRERADAVGGNLRVVSVPGKGTKVEVSIPIENGSLQTVQEDRRE